MIAGLGVPELLVILVIALLIFGPKNLPKLGSTIGKTVKNVREGMESETAEAAPEKAKLEEATKESAKTPQATQN